jgi:hypothetical protein
VLLAAIVKLDVGEKDAAPCATECALHKKAEPPVRFPVGRCYEGGPEGYVGHSVTANATMAPFDCGRRIVEAFTCIFDACTRPNASAIVALAGCCLFMTAPP